MHLQTSADLGFLMNPGEGAVTAVAFFTPESAAAPTHLLSGAADGSIAVWAAGGDWECLKLLKGHKCGSPSPLYAGPRPPAVNAHLANTPPLKCTTSLSHTPCQQT